MPPAREHIGQRKHADRAAAAVGGQHKVRRPARKSEAGGVGKAARAVIRRGARAGVARMGHLEIVPQRRRFQVDHADPVAAILQPRALPGRRQHRATIRRDDAAHRAERAGRQQQSGRRRLPRQYRPQIEQRHRAGMVDHQQAIARRHHCHAHRQANHRHASAVLPHKIGGEAGPRHHRPVGVMAGGVKRRVDVDHGEARIPAAAHKGKASRAHPWSHPCPAAGAPPCPVPQGWAIRQVIGGAWPQLPWARRQAAGVAPVRRRKLRVRCA